MPAPIRAFVVDQTADGFKMGIQQLEQRDLPPGDLPYRFTLPNSAPQVRVWMKLLSRVQDGAFQP